MTRAHVSRISHGSERDPQSTPVMFSGALVALIVGALLVLWLLGAGGSTLENCQNGDINACAELQADYREKYR
jgi:hypothetical protein